ncbi:MAG: AlkA N-terminal domain-containing protein [Segniliparus sp.]|uniref:AlkA N-terminal domain-containing protein n=1 Tax=Segniliparus sp. TaxID=2804064 RepID=UPI003F3C5294
MGFEACYRAISSKDARFDGQFYTAVATTGIYCRPSCPARTPKPENVAFYPTAAAAHLAGYRACKRCSPDAAPGSPQWNIRSDAAARAMRLIDDGVVDRDGVEGLARRLGYSSRQLNRLLTAELGAGPLALARARRAATARTLVQTTCLPFADIAFAAGFASVRQFNDTMREVFAAAPRELRREKLPAHTAPGAVVLRLPFRGRLDVPWMQWFFAEHAIAGVEEVRDGDYRRTMRLPHGLGVVCVRVEPTGSSVHARFQLADARDLTTAVSRTRRLLDLDADPESVDAALAVTAPALAEEISRSPGLRIPGASDPAELILRAMIGQQISIAAARTHTGRLAESLGDPFDDPDPSGGLSRIFPTAEQVAADGGASLRGPAARTRAILAVAQALANGKLEPHTGMESAELRKQLLDLPGIGPWTADYVVLRYLLDPDTLLDTDLVVRRGAEDLGIDLKEARRHSPWRSYFGLRLWQHALRRRGALA